MATKNGVAELREIEVWTLKIGIKKLMISLEGNQVLAALFNLGIGVSGPPKIYQPCYGLLGFSLQDVKGNAQLPRYLSCRGMPINYAFIWFSTYDVPRTEGELSRHYSERSIFSNAVLNYNITPTGKPGVHSLALLFHGLGRLVVRTVILRCSFDIRFPNFPTIYQNVKRMSISEQVSLSYI